MGEIKSTLDLVMEKTRNLKLSDEEKQAQKQSEVASRVKGLLQKLQDGLTPASQFQAEYEQLKTEFGQSDDSPLIDEIFSRFDPDTDTGIFLPILNTCCHFETAQISSMIDDYRVAYREAAQKRSLQIKDRLEKNMRSRVRQLFPTSMPTKNGSSWCRICADNLKSNSTI